MTDQSAPDYTPLSPEQLSALNETQKEIFLRLDPPDRVFFARNFTPITLGKALERKWKVMQERIALDSHDRRIRERFANGAADLPSPTLSASDVALGAAGAAGLIGMGVLARKIAPEGKASWRGVTPRDLVEPLVQTFARKERTDIRFDRPDTAGNQHATVLLRTGRGMLPGLNITLTPLENATEVAVTQITQQSLLESFKEGGQSLIGLVQDALRIGVRRGGVLDMLDLAGEVMNHGTEIAQTVNDLDLEDKAWEAIQRAALPLQAIYDEQAAIRRDHNLQLEMAWDDYLSCPRCRVEFGAGDAECRVCGAARPSMPSAPDPRRA